MTRRIRLRTRVICVLSLIPWGSSLYGQEGDIHGFVRDSVTNGSLPFATVRVRPIDKGAATNNDGFYLIAGIGKGAYEITASYVGYEPRTYLIVLEKGKSIVRHFDLRPISLETREVYVLGRRPDRYNEIGTSYQSVDQNVIKVVPVAGQEDLFRSIQMFPSIVSTSDVSSQFYVRGGAGDQNLILLDGMRIYNPFHAFGIFSVFSPDIIRSADVYSGAYPAGYGGRLSSVVSINSKSGRSDRIGMGASASLLSGQLRLEGKTPLLSKTTWLASFRQSAFREPLQKFLRRSTPLSFYDGFIKLNAPGDESGKTSIQTFFSGDRLLSPEADKPDYHWNNSAIGASFAGLIAERAYAEASMSSSVFEARVDAKQSQTIKPSSTSVREAGIHSTITIYDEQQGFYVFGLDMSFPRLEYKLTNRLGVPIRVFAEFAEGFSWIRFQRAVGSWGFDLGLQVDFASPFQRSVGMEIIQPRFSLSKEIFPFWRAKIAYGRFSQHVITVNNEDDVIPLYDAWISVPSTLRPEIADHFVAGLGAILGEQFAMDLQAYYKSYSSLVTYNRDKIDFSDPDYSNTTGEAYGLEMLTRTNVMRADVYTSYSLGWTRIHAGGFTYAPRYDRRHAIKTVIAREVLDDVVISSRWEFGSGLPFTQSTGTYDRLTLDDVFRDPRLDETGLPYLRLASKNAARLPSFHRLDLSITYTFSMESLTGSLGVHIINVYDRKNLFYFDRRTGQEIYSLPFFPTLTMTLQY